MNSSIFSLKLKDVLGAVISGTLAGVLSYLATVTDIFSISPKQIASVAVIALVTSLLKAFSTDTDGKLLGAIPVK